MPAASEIQFHGTLEEVPGGGARVAVGDDLDVTLRRDDAPREVQIPPELQRELDAAPDVKHRFDAMSFTHRREYAQWVDEAMRQETRERRAAETIEKLRQP